MNADEYLHQLESQLKGFPPGERQELLDEIASHIESGQDDPRMGGESERERKVLAEMGTPEQMGRGLRGLYRPNRLVDLLWVFVPYFLGNLGINYLMGVLYPTFPRVATATDQSLYLGIRLTILLGLVCLFVGWRRRSAPLVIFWTTEAIGVLVSLMTREHRWVLGKEIVSGTTWESLLCCAILIALLAWLVRVLEQHRFDLLLVVFTVLPLVLAPANYVTALHLIQGDSGQNIMVLPYLVSDAIYLAWPAGMALFFLAQPRDLRWSGLLLISISFAIPNLVAYSFIQEVPFMFGGMIALVFAAWILDLRNRIRGDHRLAE
jgi:hypothetical protein